MSSKLTLGSRRAAISLTSGAMLPASLRTGTTMETAGGGAPPLDVSLIFFPFGVGPSGRALWGDQRSGNPLEPRKRRARQWVNAPILTEREDKAARGEPCPRQGDPRE